MALRNHMTKAVDFFSLFFTEELIKEICNHTNTHVWQKINCKQIYADKNGAWKEKNPDEMKKFIACLKVLYWFQHITVIGEPDRSIMACGQEP